MSKRIPSTAFESTWKQRQLKNGVTISHIPWLHDQRFYLCVIVKVGSRHDDPMLMGLAHFLEHMMFRGSENHPSFLQLADAFEWLGGEWNAATSQDHTEYSFTSTIETAPRAIQLFSDFIRAPQLCDIERERQVILREIEDEENDYGHSIDLSYHMANLLWPGSSVAQPITGLKESVNNVHCEDLRSYIFRHYKPSSMSICAVGGANNQDILNALEDAFSLYTPQEIVMKGPKKKVKRSTPGLSLVPQTQERILVKWVEHADSQYHVQVSFSCDGEWHKDSSAYELISYILADGFLTRLPLRLREELGLVYDISCELNQFTDRGSLDIEASVSCENIDFFLKELTLILANFSQSGPSEKELSKAKHRAIVDLDLLISDHESLAFRYAWNSLYKKEVSLEQEKNRIQNISIEDLTELTKKLFKNSRCGLVLLGPESEDLEIRVKEILNKHL